MNKFMKHNSFNKYLIVFNKNASCQDFKSKRFLILEKKVNFGCHFCKLNSVIFGYVPLLSHSIVHTFKLFIETLPFT